MKRVLAALILLGGCVQANALPKVVSINMCLDQLVLDMAQPEQILGLSPYARDTARSWQAVAARGFPVVSGSAEEILMLRPDYVLTSRYTGAATRAFLAARAVPQEAFDAALTLADTKAQIERMGRLLGNEAKARARINALDAAAFRLRHAGAGKNLAILGLARRGYVSGRSSLIGELLTLAGVSNAAEGLKLGEGGFASLETILLLKPDALLVAGEATRAEDQGAAMLLHPALDTLFPPERRLYLPEYLTVCGGPMLAEAMDRLAAQLERLSPR